MIKKKKIQDFLSRAERLNLLPNFFLSEKYLEFSQVKCLESDNQIWIEDEEWMLFPPLSCDNREIQKIVCEKNIWSTFGNSKFSNYQCEFLDYNYIFNPSRFDCLKGNNWEIYRKNIKKWPRRNENWKYDWNCKDDKEVNLLVGNWMEKKINELEDFNILINFIFDKKIERKYLYNNNQLVAINAWDENHVYVNYRICIIKKEQSFLSEFVRYLFYTDPFIRSKNKLINDGGSLGYDGLERFKDKMNPLQKRKIYSLIKLK
jgi:hypothetical protein